MADAVTSQKLVDGTRNCVMRFTNVSDGTGEAGVTKVDVSALVGSPASVAIQRIVYSCQGMQVRILEDATTDVTAAILSQGDGDIDLRGTGGAPNTKASGYNGDLLFTTIGHSANDSYDITLYMRKKY